MPSSNKVRKVTSENYPTDAGREGELIFRLVYQQAGCKKPFSRLWLSSMEDSAIREGFATLKPSTEYDALYQAALCRERADWMVGINCSRLFSCLYGQPLAVGRVMTPVMAMTVVREAAIAAFVPEKFYTVDLELTSGCTASSRRIPEKSVAENLMEACRKEMVATIQRITRKEKSESPPSLYDLTTLQRDANRLLGYSAQQTLDYVQSLYEKKLTTYPRTDSCYITDDDEEMLEELTEELEGFLDITSADVDEAVPRTRRTVNREKVTDHHAILPTRSMLQADLDALPKGEQNVLKLIIARTLMAVSKPFRYLETLLTTECAGEEFTAKGKEVLEEGWKAVERKVLADILNRKQELTALPNVAENECGIRNAELKEGQTSPPKHFTEDLLLHAMETASADSMPEGVERQGIGTPATRAATIEKLAGMSHLSPFTHGSNADLAASMARAGVDRSIVLPVATNPAKVSHINDAAAKVNESYAQTGIFSFGCMHPDAPNWKEELSRVERLGLKGIKLHPIYQSVDLDDPRFLRILDRCGELGLVALVHAGLDIGIPGKVNASPEMSLNAIKQVGPVKLILAHMGGWRNWDQVEQLLPHTSVCLDTSFSLGDMNPAPDGFYRPEELHMMGRAQFTRMVGLFGPERIFFGTDCPWGSQKESLDRIRALPLSQDSLDAILGGNAQRLLELD